MSEWVSVREKAAELQEEDSGVGWKAEPEVVSQPTFKSSPPGLTEPMMVHSQPLSLFIYFLPSHLFFPLEGNLLCFVVLGKGKGRHRRSSKGMKLEDKPVKDVFKVFLPGTGKCMSVLSYPSHSWATHILNFIHTVNVHFSHVRQRGKDKPRIHLSYHETRLSIWFVWPICSFSFIHCIIITTY